ncbi:sensor histidine kinase [Moheibacter sediminis]|uniref:histidine kinase n=1 Tax=Moheibacter sediminis TaxID=1434700 RepID=A0A1W1Z2W1_9FLAO|nr:HAMP domain-containing sensor histidine kinase [Moheibacter sediminis]SMC42288.1 two-component system, OmpR family, phosphate regulon sensor histidine kinase PhoR [Moheibacter sediminis]
MNIKKLNIIIVLGLIATIGILIAQLIWTYKAFTLEEKKFSQKVHIALLEVARELYENNGHEFSTKDLIQRISNDYYIVNVNDNIEPKVLEHYLKTEFSKFNIVTDYEYAIYNCESDDMMYGKYISIDDDLTPKRTIEFPKSNDLVYYFAIRFPQETSYLISSLQFWFVLSFALIVILLVYVYSIYTIIQHKKYSELQRDFINNMTHEFKTPLSSILLASNYLSNQDLIQNDSKLNNYTSIITTQGKKLNNHIEKILNIARNDESALAINPIKIHLFSLLNEIVEPMLMKHENLKVEIEVNPDETIKADEFHFTNVVHNLFDNSIKYSDENPEIKITSTRKNKELRLDFSDNGIGIPSKNISFIFDKFYRVSNKKSTEVNGFGLGLFYVKKIIQQHHWKISAKNNSDKGLTISIIFPNS